MALTVKVLAPSLNIRLRLKLLLFRVSVLIELLWLKVKLSSGSSTLPSRVKDGLLVMSPSCGTLMKITGA
ncbi:MAG TPA: hypothetical protein VGL10_07275, partial [Gammaproteobacteria bacterium]